MQWGCLVSPSCSQKRENIVFELVLRSAWGLSSSGLSKLIEVVLQGAKFGVEKVKDD